MGCRRGVSMRGETYEKLQVAAGERGIPITQLLDEILDKSPILRLVKKTNKRKR